MGQKRGLNIYLSISNHFNKVNKAIQRRKKILFRKWFWNNWVNIFKKWAWTSTSPWKQKLIWGSYRSNVTAKIITSLEGNIGEYLHELEVSNDFLHNSQESIAIKAKLDKSIFKVQLTKVTATKIRSRVTNWEIILVTHTFDKMYINRVMYKYAVRMPKTLKHIYKPVI